MLCTLAAWYHKDLEMTGVVWLALTLLAFGTTVNSQVTIKVVIEKKSSGTNDSRLTQRGVADDELFITPKRSSTPSTAGTTTVHSSTTTAKRLLFGIGSLVLKVMLCGSDGVATPKEGKGQLKLPLESKILACIILYALVSLVRDACKILCYARSASRVEAKAVMSKTDVNKTAEASSNTDTPCRVSKIFLSQYGAKAHTVANCCNMNPDRASSFELCKICTPMMYNSPIHEWEAVRGTVISTPITAKAEEPSFAAKPPNPEPMITPMRAIIVFFIMFAVNKWLDPTDVFNKSVAYADTLYLPK